MFLGETTISDEKRKLLNEAFELLNIFLEGNIWMAGDTVTIADLCILATVSAVIHVGADISGYENLVKWYEQCKTIPGYEENDKEAKLYGEKIKCKLTNSL